MCAKLPRTCAFKCRLTDVLAATPAAAVEVVVVVALEGLLFEDDVKTISKSIADAGLRSESVGSQGHLFLLEVLGAADSHELNLRRLGLRLALPVA